MGRGHGRPGRGRRHGEPGRRLPVPEAQEHIAARHLFWKATGDRAHLEAAKRLLDESVANADAEARESMLTNLRLNREIMAAWRAEFGEDPEPNESQTRVAP